LKFVGGRARGWHKYWRPTFYLSTADGNQRNPRTDRLAWEKEMTVVHQCSSPKILRKPGKKAVKNSIEDAAEEGKKPEPRGLRLSSWCVPG